MMEFLETMMNLTKAFVSEIKITYIIDIAIIAFVFYKLLGLIKETRAEQLVKGFLIILIISKLSEWAKLYAINFILQSTFTIGLIALVILFQPELRKALEHLGRSQWFISSNKKGANDNQLKMINEVVDASGVMSRKKIGALIVVERMIGINDIVETGTVTDAKVSADLLMNIFYPKSPLHDGAVVIKNNRIMAAGCLLPLTSNKYISKELGTRHRAAMGMTETSDAVIIVVSEETGAISMAVEGKLQRFLDPTTLKELMIQALNQEKETNTGGDKSAKKR
ncbi:MAG: diadenylate cyclase CdaA [Clostridiales bacterium]|nr:diadenylate cyclase CdaA [Clostridiales bacterium]